MLQNQTKVFDLNNPRQLKRAEQMQDRLYNNYDHVKVVSCGFNKAKIVYWND